MCVLLLLTANHAAEGGNRRIISEKITIYYRFDSADINPDYRSNKEQIETFRNILLDPRKIDSISIHSWASPDGSSTYNLKLAQKRGENVSRFISDELKAVGKNAGISTNTHPQENWQGLTDLVSSSYTRHDKTRVLNIINDTSIGSETRKWRLQQLDGGYTWDYICRHYMPQLRTSTFVTIWISEPQTEEKPVEEASADESPVVEQSVVEQASAKPVPLNQKNEEAAVTEPAPVLALPRIPVFAIKTNTLGLAGLVPNIGLEIALNEKWSASVNWHCSWWKNDDSAWYWRTYGGDAAIRRWFGKKADESHFTGHHLGVYAQMLTYDFLVGKKGILGDKWTYAGGIEYGYSVPLSRSLHFDFTVGVGYMTGPYKTYVPLDGHYVWRSTLNRQYFGPTKAEASLVWVIDFNSKHGGQRR